MSKISVLINLAWFLIFFQNILQRVVGFSINFKMYVLVTTQEIEFLGMILNSEKFLRL